MFCRDAPTGGDNEMVRAAYWPVVSTANGYSLGTRMDVIGPRYRLGSHGYHVM
jgi:hypothetical protein